MIFAPSTSNPLISNRIRAGCTERTRRRRHGVEHEIQKGNRRRCVPLSKCRYVIVFRQIPSEFNSGWNLLWSNSFMGQSRSETHAHSTESVECERSHGNYQFASRNRPTFIVCELQHPVYCLGMVGTQNAHNVISISSDGKLCSWSLDMLSTPQEILELAYK